MQEVSACCQLHLVHLCGEVEQHSASTWPRRQASGVTLFLFNRCSCEKGVHGGLPMTMYGCCSWIWRRASRRSSARRKSQTRPQLSPFKSKVSPLPSVEARLISLVTRGTLKSSVTRSLDSSWVRPAMRLSSKSPVASRSCSPVTSGPMKPIISASPASGSTTSVWPAAAAASLLLRRRAASGPQSPKSCAGIGAGAAGNAPKISA